MQDQTRCNRAPSQDLIYKEDLTVMNICGCYGIPTDESMHSDYTDINIGTIVIDTIHLEPGGV